MIPKITKEHEGKTVYAVQTGNNYAKGDGSRVVIFLVKKVYRKYADFAQAGGLTQKLCVTTGATEELIRAGYRNSGYKFYNSLEEIEHYRAVDRKRKKVCEVLGSFHIKHVSDAAILKVYQVLVDDSVIKEKYAQEAGNGNTCRKGY